MYEHFRNEFLCAIQDSNISSEISNIIVHALDQVATKYDIGKKELGMTVYDGDLPECAKTYVVCKKIEGLSNQTLQTYIRVLTIFFKEFKKPISQITANDIRIFLFNYQKQRGCSNRSLDKYRGYLSSFFAWATDEGYLSHNPMRTIAVIKYEKKTRQNLSQIELEYLRSACKTSRERAIIEFLYSTGCRVSELSGVKRSDVNWNEKSVHLFGKGQKHRTSYINAKAEVALLEYLNSRSDDCEYLFVSERKEYRQLKKDAIEKIVRNISNRASEKIQKPVAPHILRHTTATVALQSGMPIEDISKLLGHENINTTMIYAHTSTESVRANHKRYII